MYIYINVHIYVYIHMVFTISGHTLITSNLYTALDMVQSHSEPTDPNSFVRREFLVP